MGGLDSTGFVELAVDRAGKPILLTGRHLWTFTEGRGWQPIAVPAPEGAAGYRAMTFDGMGRLYLVSERGITVVGEGGHRPLGTVGPGGRLRGQDATSVMADGDGFLWIGFQRDGISRILLENLW
jgi:ligand-binding sensor domain-containing protein